MSMNLGTIIERLQKEDPSKVVPFGWDHAYSWRGNYNALAVDPAVNVTIGTMLKVLQDAINTAFAGYHGGEYEMVDYTEVYLDQYGKSEGSRIGEYLLEFILGNIPVPLPE
jgi:hypothetical protein